MSKLYFRYGAMNCGKTAALLQVIYNYESKGLKVLLIKPEIDKKGEDEVVSRIGLSRKVDLLLSKKEKLLKNIKLDNISCILVDEAQFLTKEQVKELWIITKKYNIPVICYGLRTDFMANIFKGSSELFALSDELEELYTICSCGKKAKFNARIVNNKYVKSGEVVAIDGIDAKYESLCGKCYIEKVLNQK